MSEEELRKMPRMARVLRLDELMPIFRKMKKDAKKKRKEIEQ